MESCCYGGKSSSYNRKKEKTHYTKVKDPNAAHNNMGNNASAVDYP